jgi:hypothetical protein
MGVSISRGWYMLGVEMDKTKPDRLTQQIIDNLRETTLAEQKGKRIRERINQPASQLRREKSNNPSLRATLPSSGKTERPMSNVPASDGIKRESPKLKAAAGGNRKDTLHIPSSERTVIPWGPKLSIEARSNATRNGGRLAKQKSKADSVFHFANNNSASSFVDFTFTIPQFMEDSIKRMQAGIEDPRERALFEERIRTMK